MSKSKVRSSDQFMNGIAALASLLVVGIGGHEVRSQFLLTRSGFIAGNGAAVWGYVAILAGLVCFLIFAGSALGIEITPRKKAKKGYLPSWLFLGIVALLPISFLANGICTYTQNPILGVNYATPTDAHMQGIAQILIGIGIIVAPVSFGLISFWKLTRETAKDASREDQS